MKNVFHVTPDTLETEKNIDKLIKLSLGVSDVDIQYAPLYERNRCDMFFDVNDKLYKISLIRRDRSAIYATGVMKDLPFIPKIYGHGPVNKKVYALISDYNPVDKYVEITPEVIKEITTDVRELVSKVDSNISDDVKQIYLDEYRASVKKRLNGVYKDILGAAAINNINSKLAEYTHKDVGLVLQNVHDHSIHRDMNTHKLIMPRFKNYMLSLKHPMDIDAGKLGVDITQINIYPEYDESKGKFNSALRFLMLKEDLPILFNGIDLLTKGS